jgi:hypothetical protein
MTESQIKAQVGSLVKQGLPRKKSVSKSKISPQKKAWETRRARMVEKEKPTVIEFNGLTIDYGDSVNGINIFNLNELPF